MIASEESILHQKLSKLTLLSASLIGLVLLLPAPGAAQSKTDSTIVQQPNKSASEADVEKKKEGVKIFLDKIDILGKIEKPQTIFIIQGKDPRIEDIQIDRSFFREMFRAVEKDEIHKISQKEQRKLKRSGR